MAPGASVYRAFEDNNSLWASDWEEGEDRVHRSIEVPASETVIRGGFAQVDGLISEEDE